MFQSSFFFKLINFFVNFIIFTIFSEIFEEKSTNSEGFSVNSTNSSEEVNKRGNKTIDTTLMKLINDMKALKLILFLA